MRFLTPVSVSLPLFIHTFLNAGSREYYIRKIMATYNYDRDNAEKAFEYMKYKRANYALGKILIENNYFKNGGKMPVARIYIYKLKYKINRQSLHHS